MKRCLLTAFCCLTFLFSDAGIKVWNVSGSGAWNVAGNWSPVGVPGAGDDVIIDGTAVFFVGSFTVTLPNTAVTVNSITMTNALGGDVTLLLPATNTLTPALTVTGGGDAFLLDAQCFFKNSSGATTGSAFVITNTLRINNTGKYVHNTRSDASSILSHLSTVAGTQFGLFDYDVPGGGAYAVTLNNVTYGSLQFHKTGGAITYTATGAGDCNIKGNFSSESGATLSLSMTGNIIIAGFMDNYGTTDMQTGASNTSIKIGGHHLNSNGTGIITESGTGLPVIEFNGTALQYVSSIFTNFFFQNSVTLKVNNSAGIMTVDAIYIPYKLDFTLGKIDLNTLPSLIFMDNATYTNASALSFAENGQVRKIGDEAFAFPIGSGSMFAPLAINIAAGQLTTDVFEAEYKRTNPQGIHSAAVESGQNHVSFVEYWTLNRIVGTATKFVLLSVTPTSFCLNLNKTYVSRWNGTFWTFESTTPIAGPASPPYQTGILVSNTTFNSFGDFTLITDLTTTANPLPIKLETFSAAKISTTRSTVKWELSDICSKDANFVVEKSMDSRQFSPMTQVPGSETSKIYSINDNQLGKGITYYRLKMTDYDGTVTYSQIAALINDDHGLVITGLAPNPVHTIAVMTVTAAHHDKINFTVYDAAGKIMKQWHSNVNDGINKVPVDFSNLPGGVYQVIATSDLFKTTFRFVKQ